MLLAVAGLTPLTWATTYGGCQGGPPTAAPRTGVALLTGDAGTAAVVLALVTVALALGFAAPRVGLGLAVLAHLTAAVALAALSLLVHFASSFTLFERRDVHAPAWAAIALLAFASLEAIVRAALGFADALAASTPRRRQGD